MSEEEKKSGYCRWCDTLTNSIVKLLKHGRLIWSGCPDCYTRRAERLKNAKEKQ